MCGEPLPYQIGQRIEGNNIGRPVYQGDNLSCNPGGCGETIYRFSPDAEGAICVKVVEQAKTLMSCST